MLIDSHVHVGAWRYFDSLGRTYTTFATIVARLQAVGFSGAVLMPSELKTNAELLAEISRHRRQGAPFHCWFFPWLNPCEEADYTFVRDHMAHIDGFKFHPSLDKACFSAATHQPFLELARQHAKPVLVHCGAWLETAHYRFVLAVAAKYPDIDFILAHQGGSTYELKIGACREIKSRGLANVYLDIAGTHEYWLIEEGVHQLGAGRFLMGSDFPIRDAGLYPAVVDSCRLTDTDKARIKGHNFQRLMKGSQDSGRNP